MTKREKEIIDILKKEPMISQIDLARRLGISRSSIAVHITNLMKKEIIAGKGYMIRDESFVAVLGGANLDILGFPTEKLTPGDSCPGTVLQSLGGVGRNIAENLARLKVPVRFLTLLGDDMNGDFLLEETKAMGVDVSYIQRVREYPTGIYLAIQNEEGEMISAISQTSIYDNMDQSYPESVLPVLTAASRIVVETNISKPALEHIVKWLPDAQIFLDTVSSKKALRVKDFIGQFTTIKPNRVESEILTGIKITDQASLKLSAQWYLNQGVKNIFISLGSEGTFAANAQFMGKVLSKPVHPVNTNGAGDSFIAAMVMTSLDTDDIREWAKNGVAASIIAVLSESTINRAMTPELINEIKKEYQIEWKNI